MDTRTIGYSKMCDVDGLCLYRINPPFEQSKRIYSSPKFESIRFQNKSIVEERSSSTLSRIVETQIIETPIEKNHNFETESVQLPKTPIEKNHNSETESVQLPMKSSFTLTSYHREDFDINSDVIGPAPSTGISTLDDGYRPHLWKKSSTIPYVPLRTEYD